jgi:hypothetical protein
MASSGSPRQTLRNPLRNQAAARFGLSVSALSTNAMPPSRSPTRLAIACPPLVSATASSLPNSTARCARCIPSLIFAGDILGLGYLEYQIYCARAVVETQVKCLPLSAMENILQHDNRAKQRHVEAIQREFAFRRDLLVTANRRRPIGRVAALLFALSQLNRSAGRDPTIVGDSLKCGMVAESLGLDLDSLGGALTELEKKELIAPCPPHGLRLTDLGGLESLAGGSAITFA